MFFRFDLIDISRQYLTNLAGNFYIDAINAYHQKDKIMFEINTVYFRSLLYSLNELLGSNSNFLLGKWLKLARDVPNATPEDIQMYIFNAKNQITLWGPWKTKDNLIDYAAKQWNGLIRDYYLPRWELFFNQLELSLITGSPYNQTAFEELAIKEVAEKFINNDLFYPEVPIGDPTHLALENYKLWRRFGTEIKSIEDIIIDIV